MPGCTAIPRMTKLPYQTRPTACLCLRALKICHGQSFDHPSFPRQESYHLDIRLQLGPAGWCSFSIRYPRRMFCDPVNSQRLKNRHPAAHPLAPEISVRGSNLFNDHFVSSNCVLYTIDGHIMERRLLRLYRSAAGAWPPPSLAAPSWPATPNATSRTRLPPLDLHEARRRVARRAAPVRDRSPVKSLRRIWSSVCQGRLALAWCAGSGSRPNAPRRI